MPPQQPRPKASRLPVSRPQDYLLCALLLAASLGWLAVPSGARGGAASAAVLRHAGARLASLPLDRAARRVFRLDRGPVTVEVEPGRGVRILDSNCPAKVCVHHGWAGRAGETIACLPNRLLVEVEGGAPEYHAVVR